ncbi:TlpA disulfide reductase family protein [Sulfuricella sp.]|uniref:TlpA disulfide reductase family protein n=1 Tax=Sulfuricella sp. TaxID=2099377 RepID=UPI002C653044|nr:TlpA disulfide reductase family protein [Sulfuricella sp.]HUX64628.1 TlpA disulfide reductase family protein [Sulfuricella sp.]
MTRVFFGLCLAIFSSAVAAADFSFRDIVGKQHNLADYRGKWVLVNYWATWCPPCLKEIPDLIALHDAHKDKDLVVISIVTDYNNPKLVNDFARDHRISYPVVLGNDGIVAQIGRVEGLPMTYMFNPQGKVVAYNVGALTKKTVESYIGTKK